MTHYHDQAIQDAQDNSPEWREKADQTMFRLNDRLYWLNSPWFTQRVPDYILDARTSKELHERAEAYLADLPEPPPLPPPPAIQRTVPVAPDPQTSPLWPLWWGLGFIIAGAIALIFHWVGRALVGQNSLFSWWKYAVVRGKPSCALQDRLLSSNSVQHGAKLHGVSVGFAVGCR